MTHSTFVKTSYYFNHFDLNSSQLNDERYRRIWTLLRYAIGWLDFLLQQLEREKKSTQNRNKLYTSGWPANRKNHSRRLIMLRLEAYERRMLVSIPIATDEERWRYADGDSIDGCAKYRHVRWVLEQDGNIFAKWIPADALRYATDLIWTTIRFGKICNRERLFWCRCSCVKIKEKQLNDFNIFSNSLGIVRTGTNSDTIDRRRNTIGTEWFRWWQRISSGSSTATTQPIESIHSGLSIVLRSNCWCSKREIRSPLWMHTVVCYLATISSEHKVLRCVWVEHIGWYRSPKRWHRCHWHLP